MAVDQIKNDFVRVAATEMFLDIVRIGLPGDRSHLRLSDAAALRMLMRVIYTGVSHREAAGRACTEAELVQRHHEYAKAGVMADFLNKWPRVQFQIIGDQLRSELGAP